jgi:hypothetical protein
MKNAARIIRLAALLLVILSAQALLAQRPRMSMGRYDPKTEVTITGVVEQVGRFHYMNMPTMGVHLLVTAGNERKEVRLGPADFVEPRMTFKKGDVVEIVASKTMMMRRPVFIAREVRKGGDALWLRDSEGVPLWMKPETDRVFDSDC